MSNFETIDLLALDSHIPHAGAIRRDHVSTANDEIQHGRLLREVVNPAQRRLRTPVVQFRESR